MCEQIKDMSEVENDAGGTEEASCEVFQEQDQGFPRYLPPKRHHTSSKSERDECAMAVPGK